MHVNKKGVNLIVRCLQDLFLQRLLIQISEEQGISFNKKIYPVIEMRVQNNYLQR